MFPEVERMIEIESERGGDSTITRISDQKAILVLLGISLLWLASLFIVAYVATNGLAC